MPRRLVPLLGVACALATSTAFAENQAAGNDWFEANVRPILHARCFACHGPEKQQADLRLDQRSVVFGGEGNSPVVVPGKPDDSRLIQVVRYSDQDVQMPPTGRLPEEEVRTLTEWVSRGAPWPQEAAPPTRPIGAAIDFAAAATSHWAYHPIRRPPVPQSPANDSEASTLLDRFLTASLEATGLTLSPRADRRTLIRRATFDLLGVPPTFEDVEAFAADDDPAAWERLVSRLLADPRYGERWARHWLDVARYADTRGYVFTASPAYPFAYTYRDYVVRAFNEDKPFDQFVVEQLAADRLGLAENDPHLAALGFLTVGGRFLNREPDIIDDRIDVVTRGLMGMTAACARCHDHKFDPIPTADYYSLYGIFASCDEPEQLPLIGGLEETPRTRAYEEELAKRKQRVQDYIASARTELLDDARRRAGEYLQAVATGAKGPSSESRKGDPKRLREKLIELWSRFVQERIKQDDPAFRPWKELAAIPAGEFPSMAAELVNRRVEEMAGEETVEAFLWRSLQAESPQSLSDVAGSYGRMFAAATASLDAAKETAARPEGCSEPAAAAALRAILEGPGSVTDVPAGEEERLFERDNRDEQRRLERAIGEWEAESPDAPPRAMVLRDGRLQEPVVFIRGDVGRRGERVPRQPPRILSAGESRPVGEGSGRLDLARAIVAPDNPLTARVIVNRVWEWRFGRGLVATASDFGTRSEPPTHPELLDWLAATFVQEDGWSLKALHRRIMLSAAYQQASVDRPDCRRVDPENRLYWRMNRRRLEFEPMRDALLAVAGRLDSTIGGQPVDIEQRPYSGRRSLYTRIDRNNFSSLLRTFDYPSPDATSPGRPLTTVPQQTLYAMNAEFVVEMAQSVADEVLHLTPEDADSAVRVRELYRRILSRDPDDVERHLAGQFLHRSPDGLQELAQALLLTNEFNFVD